MEFYYSLVTIAPAWHRPKLSASLYNIQRHIIKLLYAYDNITGTGLYMYYGCENGTTIRFLLFFLMIFTFSEESKSWYILKIKNLLSNYQWQNGQFKITLLIAIKTCHRPHHKPITL